MRKELGNNLNKPSKIECSAGIFRNLAFAGGVASILVQDGIVLPVVLFLSAAFGEYARQGAEGYRSLRTARLRSNPLHQE